MTSNPDSVAKFWADVRHSLPELPPEAPEAWAFGATTKHADELLTLVLDGTKTATASSLWDYEETQEPLPEANSLSIILDGTGTPQAVIRTTEMMIVPFDQVSEEHAFCEGEGNRSLGQWRSVHERYWRIHSENSRGFDPNMPVVCEAFELLYPPKD